MIGRMYSVAMNGASVTAAKDIMRLSAASGHVLVIHSVEITQQAAETDEQLEVILQRASTDGTGTSATPFPHMEGHPSFGGTAVTNLTADTTPGQVLLREGFNIKAGFFWLPTPEMRIVIAPSGRFVVRLNTAPGAALTMSSRIAFEVIGGA